MKKEKKRKKKERRFLAFCGKHRRPHKQFQLKTRLVITSCMLYISTSFQVLGTPESWSKHFFQPVFRNCLAPAEKLKPEPNFCKLQKSKFSHPYQKCFWNFFEKESHFFSVKREIYCYFTRRLTSLQKEITFTTK